MKKSRLLWYVWFCYFWDFSNRQNIQGLKEKVKSFLNFTKFCFCEADFSICQIAFTKKCRVLTHIISFPVSPGVSKPHFSESMSNSAFSDINVYMNSKLKCSEFFHKNVSVVPENYLRSLNLVVILFLTKLHFKCAVCWNLLSNLLMEIMVRVSHGEGKPRHLILSCKSYYKFHGKMKVLTQILAEIEPF